MVKLLIYFINNLVFLDTFVLLDAVNAQVSWSYEEILWNVDKEKKFKNPVKLPGQTLCDAFAVSFFENCKLTVF